MVTMSSRSAAAVIDPAALRRDWVVASVALVFGLVAFAFLFQPEIGNALDTWRTSYAYDHCYLIIPVAGYLAWDRRHLLATMLPRPAPLVALLAIPVAAAWFAADRLGIMEGQQLTVMTLFEIMVAALFGWRMWRAFAPPLLYLFFLVPFGYFIVPMLQDVTVHIAVAGLNLTGIPNFVQGTVIEIPEGRFSVEDACSGLRFILAMAAIGVPYVCLMYTSILRRVIFFTTFLLGAFVGNCFRVWGTIVIAHLTGNPALIETEHVYWGWGFYVVVGMLMLVVGARFAEDRPLQMSGPPDAGAAVGPWHRVAVCAIGLTMVVLLAAVPRAAAEMLDRPAAALAVATHVDLPKLPGCDGPVAADAPAATAAIASRAGVYDCGGKSFELAFYVFSPRIDARPPLAAVRETGLPANVDAATIVQGGQVRGIGGGDEPIWQISQAGTPNGSYVMFARALWLRGRPNSDDLTARLVQAANSLRRTALPPVVVTVIHAASGAGLSDDRSALRTFLSKSAAVTGTVDALVGIRPAR